MLKMKNLAMMITAIAMSTIFLTSLVYAEIPATVNIYAWTDKTYYNPGEKGVLKIVVRNDRTDQDLIIKNITITYPWFGYTGDKWEGNDTIKVDPPPVILKNGGTYTKSVDFNIPTDGRVTTSMYEVSHIDIRVAVDKSPYYYPTIGDYQVPIYIKSTPLYMSFEDADKIVTLFTIQVVLIIVCTVIIAATIFLSVRRPQVTWKAEEKVQ